MLSSKAARKHIKRHGAAGESGCLKAYRARGAHHKLCATESIKEGIAKSA